MTINIRKVFLAIVIAFCIVSCESQKKLQASTQAKMNSWFGHYKSEIIQSWGPPSGGTTSDGLGGEILLYGTSRNIIAPMGNMYMTRSIRDYQQVYCNSQGKIYQIRWGRE